MYATAAAVAGGRMEDHFHYLSDVIFGAAIGIAAGRGVSRGVGDRVQVRVTPGAVSVDVPLP
jgi:hypothetical protein